MLAAFLILASFFAGFARAPWWFWVLGGVTLALLAATDPRRLRASYADVRGFSTLPLLFGDVKGFVGGCMASAVAFGLGRTLAELLIL